MKNPIFAIVIATVLSSCSFQSSGKVSFVPPGGQVNCGTPGAPACPSDDDGVKPSPGPSAIATPDPQATSRPASLSLGKSGGLTSRQDVCVNFDGSPKVWISDRAIFPEEILKANPKFSFETSSEKKEEDVSDAPERLEACEAKEFVVLQGARFSESAMIDGVLDFQNLSCVTLMNDDGVVILLTNLSPEQRESLKATGGRAMASAQVQYLASSKKECGNLPEFSVKTLRMIE
jgi:hypothetical protein